MGLMETTWYLPDEVLSYRNYPEVATVESTITDIMNYALTVESALDNYNSGVVDKVDVDVVALQLYAGKCRSVADVLGHATNVCYDMLVEIRELQDLFQGLIFIRNRYGNQYIGTPTDTSLTATNDNNTI